eukprot:scaffold72817_cov19-Prasinocladus_malaysianus.AAC.1
MHPTNIGGERQGRQWTIARMERIRLRSTIGAGSKVGPASLSAPPMLITCDVGPPAYPSH